MEKAAQKIASFLFRIQLLFARGMQRLCARLTMQQVKGVVVFFFLLGGGLSIYHVQKGVFGKKQPQMKMQTMQLPRHVHTMSDSILKPIN